MQPTSSQQATDQERANQRRHERHKRLVKVWIADAAGKGEPTAAWVANCSLGGLGLLLHREVAPGTILTIRPSTAPVDFKWLQVEVKYCHAAETEHNWELGCRFVRAPSYSVLLMFR